MIFDGKPTRDITVDELRRLVAECVAEDKHLEYKQQPYDPRDPVAVAKLLKSVTGLANADGGYLIIGIQDNGSGRAAGFVNSPNAEDAKKSIVGRCLAKIQPRMRELDVGILDVDANTILVVHVPESDRKPLCAWPDAEHHYFWRRYEDGNKLMNTAEIRECFEADRVHRELVELRREFVEHSRQHVVSREAETEVTDSNLFQLQTPEKFLAHMEQEFRAETDERPYYRLWATPIPINEIRLQDRRTELLKLLRRPPKLRNGGWDVTPVGDFRQTATGLACERTDFRHLRLLWNGHLEFWNRADDLDFHPDEINAEPPFRFLYPYAIIETTACFGELARKVCRIADYHGDVRFGLGLYRISGQMLLPHAPQTMGYMMARSGAGLHDVEPFKDKDLIVGPVTSSADELPDAVAWQLVSRVYSRFGYTNEEIPFFDAEHTCTLDEKRKGEEGSP